MNKIKVESLLSPDMKKVIAKQEELATFATDATLCEMRENYAQERAFWNEGAPVMEKISDETIQGPQSEIPVRYYYPPEHSLNAPALIFIHGGGFVVGSIETHDRICRILAQETKAVVVSVDYQLSPEAKFPHAIRECAAVASFLHENGGNKGIDPSDIGFVGDSGGANLSFGSFLYLRDTAVDVSYITSLLLFYPLLGLKDSPSRRLLGGPLDGLSEADLMYYNTMYAEKIEDLNSPYFDVFTADLTSNIPPTFNCSAELDPLKDDSRLLDEILTRTNQKHKSKVYPGVLHGFLHYTKMLPAANEALQDGAIFYKNRKQQ